MPFRASKEAAGLDLFLVGKSIIKPRSRELLNTKISIEIPKGHYGRIASRSGFSLKKGLEVGAGVIDSDYKGEIKVLLYNHSDKIVELDNNIAIDAKLRFASKS